MYFLIQNWAKSVRQQILTPAEMRIRESTVFRATAPQLI
jgi:hypothetical protein